MAPVATKHMPKKSTDVCTYASIRIDDEVLPIVRAAAALSGDITIQEFLSDIANEAASRVVKREPIKRRPAPPKPHGKGRPKKQP